MSTSNTLLPLSTSNTLLPLSTSSTLLPLSTSSTLLPLSSFFEAFCSLMYSAGRKVLSGMYLNLTKVSPLDEIQKPQNLETEFDSGHFLGTAG